MRNMFSVRDLALNMVFRGSKLQVLQLCINTRWVLFATLNQKTPTLAAQLPDPFLSLSSVHGRYAASRPPPTSPRLRKERRGLDPCWGEEASIKRAWDRTKPQLKSSLCPSDPARGVPTPCSTARRRGENLLLPPLRQGKIMEKNLFKWA